MTGHLAGLAAAAALVVLCMFYAFLPGPYDGLAVTLSAMARVFGMAGLVLVPLGALWLAYELRARGRGGSSRTGEVRYRFGVAAVGLSTVVALAVALAAVVDAHQSLGVAVLALWAYSATRMLARLRARRGAVGPAFDAAPLYLVVVPVVAAVGHFAFVGPAAELSRNRAIDHGSGLITGIERYREAHGHYPRSLQSLWDDYRPPVVGIERFRYEPSGDGYNVYFEHPAGALDVKEVVMYNRHGAQEFTSHSADLLQRRPEQLARMRGYVAVRDAGRPRWKYFLFD